MPVRHGPTLDAVYAKHHRHEQITVVGAWGSFLLCRLHLPSKIFPSSVSLLIGKQVVLSLVQSYRIPSQPQLNLISSSPILSQTTHLQSLNYHHVLSSTTIFLLTSLSSLFTLRPWLFHVSHQCLNVSINHGSPSYLPHHLPSSLFALHSSPFANYPISALTSLSTMVVGDGSDPRLVKAADDALTRIEPIPQVQ